MIFAKQALLTDGWASDVRLTVANGCIANIKAGGTAQATDRVVDTLLPALSNLHSHTFQRAMAGMTEVRKVGRDSFWTWRDLMYRFMDRLTPAQIEAIAAQSFMEMQEAGYAAAGEFHYVHHQTGGVPYENIAELSARVFAAAADTGIGLTHLPVLYTYGGAGCASLAAGQRRFGNDVDRFGALVSAAREALNDLPADARIGIAPHSLRATSPDDLRVALTTHEGGPVHIHIAEQPREVSEIQEWLGGRPVEWLLSHFDVDEHWCLIHATHMTPTETTGLANSRAVAGLCPVTEANLGDGPFNGPQYLAAGGAFGVGTDSNINISLTEELRALEYSQRLRDVARNVMVTGEGSVGATLYTSAARGGAQALGRNAGVIATGRLADLVAINSDDPRLCALAPENLLDGLIFAANDNTVTDVWSAGRHQVSGGRHIARDHITAHYRAAVQSLMASL